MTSAEQQSIKYKKAIKTLSGAFEGFTLSADGCNELASIMCEINRKLITACVNKTGKALEISCKHAVQAIKTVIPKDMRECALAAGNRDVFKFAAGELQYKGVPTTKREVLRPEMFKYGLGQLALSAHRNLTLSSEANTAAAIIHKLAIDLASQIAHYAGNRPEMTLQDVITTVRSYLAQELFTHADCHASANLQWYDNDLLDFRLKHPSDTFDFEADQIDVFRESLKKLVRQFGAQLAKDASVKLDEILWETADAIANYAVNHARDQSSQSLDEFHIQNALTSLFPEGLRSGSNANAQAKYLCYKTGFITFEPTPREEREGPQPPSIRADFRRGLRRLTDESPISCTFGKGFFVTLNDIMNDICESIAIRSAAEATKNPSALLTEMDVLQAVHAMFPEQLRSHAIARLLDLQRQLKQANREVIGEFEMLPFSDEEQPASPGTMDQPSSSGFVEQLSSADFEDHSPITQTGIETRVADGSTNQSARSDIKADIFRPADPISEKVNATISAAEQPARRMSDKAEFRGKSDVSSIFREGYKDARASIQFPIEDISKKIERSIQNSINRTLSLDISALDEEKSKSICSYIKEAAEKVTEKVKPIASGAHFVPRKSLREELDDLSSAARQPVEDVSQSLSTAIQNGIDKPTVVDRVKSSQEDTKAIGSCIQEPVEQTVEKVKTTVNGALQESTRSLGESLGALSSIVRQPVEEVSQRIEGTLQLNSSGSLSDTERKKSGERDILGIQSNGLGLFNLGSAERRPSADATAESSPETSQTTTRCSLPHLDVSKCTYWTDVRPWEHTDDSPDDSSNPDNNQMS